jgi:hypothetical protein
MTPVLDNSPASAFYRRALQALAGAGIPFLVGGAWALERYTGIARDTKDLDVFVRPGDGERGLRACEQAGFETELTFPHWLGKAFCRGEMVDIIFSSGNGFARVDEEWFGHAPEHELLGLPVRLVPVEEMIWSKAFIMERERYDGADVAHLLLAHAARLDWPRLLRRFGPHWRVLLSHLVLFGFCYPGHRREVPENVMRRLLDRLAREAARPAGRDERRVCRGTLLSRAQYLPDVEQWGYRDARLVDGTMTRAEVACWTAAIDPPRPAGPR